MLEIWVDIEGYEGMYQVSTLGRVKSVARTKFMGRYYKYFDEHFIVQRTTRGYKEVKLCKDGKQKNIKVHRLVAKAFVDNPFDKKYVNHIDGIKSNNLVENLEWTTPKENSVHAMKNGLIQPDLKRLKIIGKMGTKKVSKPIVIKCKDGNMIGEFISISDGARTLGVSVTYLRHIKNGRYKNPQYYVYELEKENEHGE